MDFVSLEYSGFSIEAEISRCNFEKSRQPKSGNFERDLLEKQAENTVVKLQIF